MKNKKITSFEIISLFSVLGMICWYLTDYFGGMIIHIFQYWYLIIPILILYVGSFLKFLIKVLKKGFKSNKILIFIHSSFFIFLLITYIFESDLLKSKRILTGTLRDDLSNQTLILRKDGTCENNIIGFLGFKKRINGSYFMKGDTIIFIKKPYDNDFLPDTLYLNKNENAIFLYKNTDKKKWLNHFELE